MATKTISLDENAYERLKELKKEGESFSDVVKRISSERKLTEIAGVWEDSELEDIVERTRKKTDKEVAEKSEELK